MRLPVTLRPVVPLAGPAYACLRMDEENDDFAETESRPAVVVQDDRFDATASVTVCPFTTNPVDAPLVRIRIEPSDNNGLDRSLTAFLGLASAPP